MEYSDYSLTGLEGNTALLKLLANIFLKIKVIGSTNKIRQNSEKLHDSITIIKKASHRRCDAQRT